MYPEYMRATLEKVEKTRERRYKLAKEKGKEVFTPRVKKREKPSLRSIILITKMMRGERSG